MKGITHPSGNYKAMVMVLCILGFVGCVLSHALPRVSALSMAPDFTTVDTEGTPFTLSDFRGRVILLEFMQTNSSQCIEQILHLRSLHNEFDNDLVLMSLSIQLNDTIEILRQFREDYNTTWIYAQSSYDVYAEKYNVTSVPTLYLVDQEGSIQHHFAGVVEDTILRLEIQRLLTSLLTISTSPNLEQMYFQINGQDYYTDISGTIRIDLRIGSHTVELVDTLISRDGIEYQFIDWSGIASGTANPLIVNISETKTTIALQANFQSYDVLPPIADAGGDQLARAGQVTTFDGSNSSDNVGVLTYTWTFHDLSWYTLIGIQATHIFLVPGEYHVTLNVTDAAGHWATDALIITVQDHTAPTANAGEDQTITEDTLLILNASASFDDVGIQSHVWTFWDGGPVAITGMITNYTFHTPDIYRITLTVTDTAGNEDVDSIIITVIDVTNPIAEAGPDTVILEDRMVFFNGSSSWDENNISIYTWTFIDRYPKTLNGISPNYTFINPGEYRITLRVTDTTGNKATDTMTVLVLDVTEPRAHAGQNHVTYISEPVTFDAALSTDNGRIISYTWNYGDGDEGTGSPSTHIYHSPGHYNVTLTVKDAANNIGTDYTSVIVLDRKTLIIDTTWIPLLIIIAVMNLLIIQRFKQP